VYGVVAIAASLENVSPLALGGGTFWALAPLYVAAFWFGVRLAEDGRPAPRPWPGLALIATTMLVSGAVTLLRATAPDARWLMWLPYSIGLVGGCAAVAVAVSWPAPAGPRPLLDRTTQALVRAGRSSLGIYFIHPVLLAPATLVLSGQGGAIFALVSAVLTVVLATWLIERLFVAA
jgi:peptidoglycan/LPS O-acetylase OafA/YrhL